MYAIAYIPGLYFFQLQSHIEMFFSILYISNPISPHNSKLKWKYRLRYTVF